MSLFFFLLNKFFWLSSHIVDFACGLPACCPLLSGRLGHFDTMCILKTVAPWLLYFCKICYETFCCPLFLFLTFTEETFDVGWERFRSITYWELNHAYVALMKTRWVLIAYKKAKFTDKILFIAENTKCFVFNSNSYFTRQIKEWSITQSHFPVTARKYLRQSTERRKNFVLAHDLDTSFCLTPFLGTMMR